MLTDEQCWQAIVRRDRTRDGDFYFGVTTTGVFCRPSCAARRPLRTNVRFYPSPAAAEKDGLRACLRCQPLDRERDREVERMRELCEHIRQHSDSGDRLTLAALARRAGLSPARLRRVFRQVVGVTPREYVDACRFDTLKSELRQGEPVTDAIYQAGFGSSSRVYEQSDSRLGMTPSVYRQAGQGEAISYAFADTAGGRLLLAATDRGLCSVRLGDSDDELLDQLRDEFTQAELQPAQTGSAFEAWLVALQDHLDGRAPHLDLPTDVRATAFQESVWQYLKTIPRGETRTYTQVAEAIGKPRAVRAVASACAANRIAIVVPCHRVLRTDGDLAGFRWGRDRKRLLLDSEATTGRTD